jgi:hypothetical protein
MDPINILVIDDDFEEYDTKSSLEAAIERLAQEGIECTYKNITQEQASSEPKSGFLVYIVDNDFGDGMKTLSELVMLPGIKAYISAYDLVNLRLQYERQGKEGIDPFDFDAIGITLLQKRGKNVAKDVTQESLTEQLYNFLKLCAE